MSSADRTPRMAAILTTLLALLLQLLPLPTVLAWLRPSFAVLTVLFWSMAAPRAGGFLLGITPAVHASIGLWLGLIVAGSLVMLLK